MNIAVCDDEAVIRKQLMALVKEENGIGRIDEFSSADALLDSPERYQLVFLDIQMPGVDGVEAARPRPPRFLHSIPSCSWGKPDPCGVSGSWIKGCGTRRLA